MEVALAYVKSDDVPTFANDMIQEKVAEVGMEDVEIHEVDLLAECVLVPLICRKFCQRYPYSSRASRITRDA
jgi:hypothetical protein